MSPEPERSAPAAAAGTGGHDGHDAHGHGDGHGDGHDIHMPPNSWIPIVLALTLTATMIGFTVGPWMWITGLVLSTAGLGVWYKAARTEFEELPD